MPASRSRSAAGRPPTPPAIVRTTTDETCSFKVKTFAKFSHIVFFHGKLNTTPVLMSFILYVFWSAESESAVCRQNFMTEYKIMKKDLKKTFFGGDLLKTETINFS